MTREEAIKYLIEPVATSTEPSEEYMKQKEAYNMAIEALERKRGEWIAYNGDDTNWLRNDGSPVFMQCSVCNTMVVNNFAFNWNYCPNCGAKMKEVEE